MKRDFNFKTRDEGKLPPEQLLAILQKIYPDEQAQLMFEHLMKPEEENE